MPLIFGLYLLLQMGIIGGIGVFCLGCLWAASDAHAKRTAEAFGLNIPFALIVFGMAVFIAWFRARASSEFTIYLSVSAQYRRPESA